MEILGYVQPCVAHAGETVDVKVSTTHPEFTAEAIRLTSDEQAPVPQVAGGSFPGRWQDLVTGSYLVADLGEEQLPAAGCTAAVWFCPTLLRGRQCLMAGTGPGGGWELAVGEDGRLSAARLSEAGEVVQSASGGPPLAVGRWYFAAAAWEPVGRVTLAALPRHAPGSSEAGGISEHELTGQLPFIRTVTAGAVLAAGRASRCFNGKIDTPRLFTGALSPATLTVLAADAPADRIGGLRHEWRFCPEASLPPHRVRDTGPGRCDATLVNMPTLGVRGRNWVPGTEGFPCSPHEYQAAHFHEDDLTDAQWESDFSFQVPAGWASGVYGIRLRAGEHEDVVPLIVSATPSPRGAGRAPVAVLLPTFSYLAYANEHASWENPIASAGDVGALPVTEQDRFMAAQRLLSLYEVHADGSGSCLSSWRRPVLNMRPGYHLPLIRGPHQFSEDLELLHWLESRGIAFDVITDDDLHRRGAAALDPYRVVLTGSHPEYYSTQMLDGVDSYLAVGGRLMYLGGNGFYWVTTAPADDPFVVEVRRGQAGTRVWEASPGEWHHAMTGERGGLWRHRGRSPQSLAGVGFTAQGFDQSLAYEIRAAPGDERTGFILEGIDPAAPLGGRGSVLGGPAGFEIDRADAALGTPGHSVVIATATGFTDAYQGAVEDVTTADSQQGGSVCGKVRSDVVFFETAAGGAVFSVGSIAWCGALREDGRETPVGRMTWNVLSRFCDPEPFSLPAPDLPAPAG